MTVNHDDVVYWFKVPGGVGPMTIAMLMRNTLASFKRSLLSKSK